MKEEQGHLTFVFSALKWLPGIWEPFFVQFHRTVVAPGDLEMRRNVSIFTSIDTIIPGFI